MFSKKSEFITAKFCIFFLISIFALTFIRILSRTIILKTDRELSFGKIIFFDREDLQIPDSMIVEQDVIQWSKQYPFLEETENTVNIESKKNNISDKTNNKTIKLEIKQIANATEKIQTWVKSNFILRSNLIDFCSTINSFFKWKPEILVIVNGEMVQKLPNGHFTVFIPKGDVSEKVESVNSFNEFLKTKNIPFLYVQAPYKLDPNDKTISGVLDYSNQNADEFLQQIALKKINFIDMRKEIENTGKDFYSFFYKTDHHWTAETGLWATKIITEKLNSDFDLNIDTSIYNPEKFNYTIYEKSLLGSRGRTRKLPLKYMEDIILIEPKENYSLTANIYSSNSVIREKSGNFETLIFKERLSTKENAYFNDAYWLYIGDRIANITNHSSKNKTHILILGDSFTDVVETFLCLGVAQLDCVDLRHFTGSLKTWIDTHKHYDVCIFLINAGAITGEIDKTNHTDLWDFR